jgi:hypothetical protein
MTSMGRDIHAPQDLLFYVGGGSIHFGGWFFQDPPGIPGNVQFFSGECLFTALIKRKYVRGLGIRKAHYFWQMDFIHLAKRFLVPCKAYSTFQHISVLAYFNHFMARGFMIETETHWVTFVYVRVSRFVDRKNEPN